MRFSGLHQHLSRYFSGGTFRARFASGAMWVLIGMGLSQVISALSSIVIARVLSQELFGEFGMVRNTVTMFGALAGLGLGLTANKFIAELRDSDPARAGRILALTMTLAIISGTIAAVALAGAADYLAARTLKAEHLAPYLRLSAPLLTMLVISGVQLGALSGLEQFRALSVLTIATGLTVSLAAAIGALVGGIEGAFYGMLIGSFLNLLLLEMVVTRLRRRKQMRMATGGMWGERHVLHSFAMPSMLAGLMVTPVTWAALRLLFIGQNGAAETAVFQAANQLRMVALFIPGAIAQVVLPVLSNIQSEVDASRYQRAVRLTALACLAAGAIVALPLMIASPHVMGLFGPSFSSGWLVLCLLCGSAILQATNNVIGQALAALNKMWWGFWLNCLWAIEFLIAAALLVQHGAAGLAGAYLISYLLHTAQVWLFVTLAIRRRGFWQASPVQVPSGVANEWI